MDLYDAMLPEGYRKIVHEDNTAAVQIAASGINKTMRHLNRNQGIAVRYLYEQLGDPDRKDDIQLFYTRTEWMAADIYTKHFKDKGKWQHALEMINICGEGELEGMIKRRRIIYQQMEVDYIRHPNNVRQHKASEAAARCYRTDKTSGAGSSLCWEAQRLIASKNRNGAELSNNNEE